jgi:hypothetical protein
MNLLSSIAVLLHCMITVFAVTWIPDTDTVALTELFVPHVTAMDKTSNNYIGGQVNYKIATGAYRSLGYITKLNKDGMEVWTAKITSSGNSRVDDVYLDNHGFSYCVGEFSGTISLNSIPTIQASGKSDMFIVKFNPSGNPVWVKNAGYDWGYAKATGVSVDAHDFVYVTGEFDKAIRFKNTDGKLYPYRSSGSSDVFTAKFSPDGDLQWVEFGHGSSEDHAAGIATNSEGLSCITGTFLQDITFGIKKHLNPLDAQSAFVAQYNESGQPRWSLRLKAKQIKMDTIDTDKDGYCYVTGSFREYLDIGNYPGIYAALDGPPDVHFMIKFSHSGAMIMLQNSQGVSCGNDCHIKLSAEASV